MSEAPNFLYYGDNLDVLHRHAKDETVDLVYLDPPFKSNQDYNVLFAEHGERSAAQIKAFEDTWRWDEAASRSLWETVDANQGSRIAEALLGFQRLVPESDMLAYLAMMAPRLIELRRVLKPAGSLYLHCDPAASHYLKVVMDAVFGPESYRTEIIWRRARGFKRSSARRFPHKHDVILFYCKDPRQVRFHPQYRPHKPEYIKRFKQDENGRLYRDDVNPTGGGRRRIYLDQVEGDLVDSVWDDINPINPVAAERLGYPTQKPEALLERIVRASTVEGDLVLDPFCGCGTAVAVAERLDRRWVGIDITHLAINLIRHRLHDAYGPQIEESYQVIGEPVTVDDAEELARTDPYQFQWWALGLVGARPAEQKKGADKGIDGRIYFQDEAGKTKQIVLSVKAGKTGRAHVHELRGVLAREGADISALISFYAPTQPMREEAASAGFYTSPTWNTNYPRIQLLTVGELLEGKGLQYPHVTGTTFKKAPKADPESPEAERLPGLD